MTLLKENVCPSCGRSSQTVFVHVHEQCLVCKTNVEPCSSGQELVNGELKTIMEEITNKLEQNLKMKNITKY
jgi:phosphoribosyl-dephospho-CoA transferase